MKFQVLAVALASVGVVLPSNANAADDFCSRLVIQAINQFCQLLPNGQNLCQPIALVGPTPECTVPERQALVPVPLGPPTVQPPTPWTAPYTNRSIPPSPIIAPTASMQPRLPAAGTTAAIPASPTRTERPSIAIDSPKEVSAPMPAVPPVSPISVATTPPVPVAINLPTVSISPDPATSLATTHRQASQPTAEPVAAATTSMVPAANAMVAPVAEPVVVTPAETVGTPATPSALATASTSEAASDIASPPAKQPTTASDDSVDALAHFDFDSAILTTAGREALDTWLAKSPKGKIVRVSGYADRLGPEGYNLKLSLRRAEAVKLYLTSNGIDAHRIQLEAKGETEPVTRCKGEATPAIKECLAPNRRVRIDPE